MEMDEPRPFDADSLLMLQEVPEFDDIAQPPEPFEISDTPLTYDPKEIASIQDVIQSFALRSTHWSSQYRSKETEFRRTINGYVAERQALKNQILAGALTADQILARGRPLGQMLARAYGFLKPDGSDWSDDVRAFTAEGGDAYTKASRVSNCLFQCPEFARAVLLAGFEVAKFVAPDYAFGLSVVGSTVNYGFVIYQAYSAVMVPIQSAAAGAKGIAQQLQWGDGYAPAVKSSKYTNEEGKEANLPEAWRIHRRLAKINSYKDRTYETALSDLRSDALKVFAEAKATVLTSLHAAEDWRHTHPESKFIPWMDDYIAKAALLRDETFNFMTGDIVAELKVMKDACDALKKIPYGPAAVKPSVITDLMGDYDDIVVDNRLLIHLLQKNREGGVHKELFLNSQGSCQWELAISKAYTNLHLQAWQSHGRLLRVALNLGAAGISLYGSWQAYSKLIGGSDNAAQVIAPVANQTLGAMGNATAPATNAASIAELDWNPLAIELASAFVSGVVQPFVYWYTQPCAAARDYRHKLLSQFIVIALTGAGRLTMDSPAGGILDIARIDRVVKSSMRVRLEHLQAVLKFDQMVYKQAILTHFIDPGEFRWEKAQSTDIRVPHDFRIKDAKDEHFVDYWIPLTFEVLGRIFDQLETPEDRHFLLDTLAKNLHLKIEAVSGYKNILKQYETNRRAMAALDESRIATLFSAKEILLSPATARMLLDSLSFASFPLHAPQGSVEAQVWKEKKASKAYVRWKRADRNLANMKGNAVKFSSNPMAAEAAQKLGQSMAYGILGSATSPTLKSITSAIGETLLWCWGRSNPAPGKLASKLCKLTGSSLSCLASMLSIGMCYSYHQFIALKNIQMMRMDAQGVQDIAHGSISDSTRDFGSFLNTRVIAVFSSTPGQVLNFTTIAAPKINQDDYPPVPLIFERKLSVPSLTQEQIAPINGCVKFLATYLACCRVSPTKLEELDVTFNAQELMRIQTDAETVFNDYNGEIEVAEDRDSINLEIRQKSRRTIKEITRFDTVVESNVRFLRDSAIFRKREPLPPSSTVVDPPLTVVVIGSNDDDSSS